jgi:exonuclease III/ribonuclease HI
MAAARDHGDIAGLMPGVKDTDIFCLQELVATSATNHSVEDAFSVATGLGWKLHHNHFNVQKKGGGAAILTSQRLRHSKRRQYLEPDPDDEHSQHLDVVVASVGMMADDDSNTQLLVASIYRSPGNYRNVTPLCALIKRLEEAARRSFAGLVICGDFNLHLRSIGNAHLKRTAKMNEACKQIEEVMKACRLGALNQYGAVTRFEKGKQSSSLDVSITSLPATASTERASKETRIDTTAFRDSWTTLPAVPGLDHLPISMELLLPNHLTPAPAAPPSGSKPKCKICWGRGAEHAESLRKIRRLLERHGLEQNSAPKLERGLLEEEKPVFVKAVTTALQEHLSNPSSRAGAFDSSTKHLPHEPWTMQVSEGMAQLANCLTKAMETVIAARARAHPSGRAGSGTQSQAPRRTQSHKDNAERICFCPTPATRRHAGPGMAGRERFRFWTKDCAETKRKWNRAKRNVNAATARRAGPSTLAHLRVDAHKKRVAHRRAATDAKRCFWGIKEGKLDRFTSTKELHKLLDLLGGEWTTEDQAQDALVGACEKRGGVKMTAKDGTEVTARSAGPQAADLLTKHFKQTTERMTDEEAIAITERVVRRRQEENRRLPDRFPHAKDLLNHVKRHLIETDEWLANRQAKGGSLEQTTPEAAPALPPANSKHCGRAFSIAEVAACKHKRKGKATWHEKITTEMMDAAGPLWDQCFATMLNLTLLTGAWPLWFKDARMRHLIKPKAKTYSSAVDAKHTRPISIIPAMAKRADAMMYKRTEYMTEAKDEGTELGDTQFGFRPQRGCVDNLFAHLQEVKSHWRRGWFCVEVCRDGVKAYDKVHHASLLRKLSEKHNVKGPLLRMIAGFLRNRTAHTLLGESVGDTFDLDGGVPQGACASPGLYIVDVDEQARLCDKAKSPLLGTPVGKARVSYYADDARIYIALPGPKAKGSDDWKADCTQALSLFQDLLDESTILAAMSRQAFSPDPSKLQSIAYIPDGWGKECRKEILEALPILFVQDQRVEIDCEPIKALGLKLDSGLTFEKHITAKVGMAHQRLDVMERLNSEPWYTDVHTMVKRVYSPWVASLWEYASPCWGSASPHLLKRIDAAERRAMAICLKIPSAKAIARLVLLREAKCDSAQQRRLVAAAMHWHKINSSRPDSQAGRMLREWKDSSDDWRAEVEEAKAMSAWVDVQTEKVLGGARQKRGALKQAEAARPLITPLAFCAAAAETLQMTKEQVGLIEPFGLEDGLQRQCPFSSDPCGGYAMPLPLLQTPITTESMIAHAWDLLFPRGRENHDYDKPILGSASERDEEQKRRANAYALALSTCATAQAQRHPSSVVCATDGACQTSYGPSVLAEHRHEIQGLWRRQGGGGGAAIANGRDTLLAAFHTKHGQVSDSAADEMAGMHALMMALVAAYLGPEVATSIDQRRQSTGAIRGLKWQTDDHLPPRCLSIERGETTIIITCDNQDVARAGRTESLTAAPHKGGTARAPGYATHNEIVEAKRALTKAGASVQIVWVPGHTDTCKLNIEADEQADEAAVTSANTSQGGDALTSARPMLRNHMRRRARQLLNNSWYHWYKEQQTSPWGPRRAAGHTYLEQCVLWVGNTVNWLDKEEDRQNNARDRPRWLAVPEQIIMASNRFNAAKAIIRARLNMPTRNVVDARMAKVAHPQCPWCHKHADSARHRFECGSLQPSREALADKMWQAVAPSADTVQKQRSGTREWKWNAGQVLRANFTWDVLVKGSYKGGMFYNLERFTAPPKETRQALAGILHDFLEATRFFNRVFGWQADRTKAVEVAHSAHIKEREAAYDAHSEPVAIKDN